MIWIVESSAFGTGREALMSAIAASGGAIRWISEDDEFRGRYGKWEEDDVVVFRGSFQAAESFRVRRPGARPGVIGEAEALRCASYYPHVGSRLLNEKYTTCRAGDLRERWPYLQELFGPAVFIRPDSGAKAFTGQLVTDFERFEIRERIYLQSMSEEELVVAAAPRQIEEEWRTVIVGKEAVAGSRYKSGGKKDVSPEVPADVLAFAKETASEIQPPAAAYMLDVAREQSGRLSVVELNSFSCSDLYECDPVPVVAAIRDLYQP
jgi:hypothetical protein